MAPGKCLDYSSIAAKRLRESGYDVQIRFFDCGETLHAAACIKESGICIDSDHRDPVMINNMGCPLAR